MRPLSIFRKRIEYILQAGRQAQYKTDNGIMKNYSNFRESCILTRCFVLNISHMASSEFLSAVYLYAVV